MRPWALWALNRCNIEDLARRGSPLGQPLGQPLGPPYPSRQRLPLLPGPHHTLTPGTLSEKSYVDSLGFRPHEIDEISKFDVDSMSIRYTISHWGVTTVIRY